MCIHGRCLCANDGNAGGGQKAQERNELRRCLRNFFPRRKLFTMERPAADANLTRLEELREDELQPGFRKQVDAFCRYIWEEAPVKVLPGGHQVTGSGEWQQRENGWCAGDGGTCVAVTHAGGRHLSQHWRAWRRNTWRPSAVALCPAWRVQ